MSIESDVQLLAPGAIIDLYEIDGSRYGLDILRYCAHTNELGQDVVFNGNTYYRFPIMVDGFEKRNTGTLPRPTITVSNIQGLIGALLRASNNLLGCRVTRHRTFVKYLDAVNFVAGNSSADPLAGFPDEVYYVDRKSAEEPEFVQLELAVSWDVQGKRLPSRQFIRDTCVWEYRGGDCGYTGGPVADANDSPVTLLSQDACSQQKSGCRLRFPAPQSLPASFFPAIGLLGG